jgi:hypothetical protein
MDRTPAEELKDLRGQIATENQLSVQLELSIIAKTKDIMAEKAKVTELKQRRRAGVDSTPGGGHIDTEGLSPDYVDVIWQKKDAHTHLRRQLSEQEDALLKLGLQSELLFEEQTTLLVDLHRTTLDIYEEESRNVPLRMNNVFFQDRLKELDPLIAEAETMRSKTEVAVSTAKRRLDDHEFRGGGIVDLQNSIASLNTEIAVVERFLEEHFERLAQNNSQDDKEQRAHADTISSMKRLYDWGPQKAAMEKECTDAKHKLQTNQVELVRLERQIAQKEQRFKVLEPIAKQRLESARTVQIPDNVTIDSLIQELERKKKQQTRRTSANETALEEILMQNGETERIIELKNREFTQLSLLLQNEVAGLKKKIAQARLDASQKEFELVSQINALSAKLKAQSAPRKPGDRTARNT